jgi:Winged helix-turn-helix DNA-binding
MTQDATADARALIEERIAEIDEERGRLTRAIAALGGSIESGLRRQRKAAPGKRGRSQRRGSRGLRPKEVLDFIQAHPETTATQVAEAIGISSTHVNGIVGKLRKEGKVAKGTPLRPS